MRWIDDFIKEAQRDHDRLSRSEDIRIQDDRLFRALAPQAWEHLIEVTKAALVQLRTAKPGDKERHAQLIRVGESYLLQNEKFPVRILQLEFSLDSHSILVHEGVMREQFAQVSFSPRDPIRMDVRLETLPHYEWRGETIFGSEALAERLICHVCNIIIPKPTI